ncbi:MAG: hypothetical protein IPK55_12035 [Streptococcus sp.]|nr:hypothetical protein [Streptococcus sp.]
MRIGANDYDPPKEVKERTLDFLVDREIGGNETVKVDYNKIDEIRARLNTLDKIQQVSA